MKSNKLVKAIGIAIAGMAITGLGLSNALASTTMYNKYNESAVANATDAGALGTDGWTWSDGSQKGNSVGAVLNPWVGSVGYNTNPADPRPFNYTGSSALNWAANITQAGDSLQISQADSFNRFGVYADIDTAGGAWRDASGKGWAHNTDIGLFKSDVTTDVTLKVSAINGPIANFGITIFTGMDTGAGYSHHSTSTGWNNTNPLAGRPPTLSNPFGTTDVNYVGGLGTNTAGNASYMTGITSTNGFTFTAQSGVIYSIYLGGYGGTNWNQQHDGYVLNISTPSAVPIPAAGWLMGSGLVGLLSYTRRKKIAAVAPN